MMRRVSSATAKLDVTMARGAVAVLNVGCDWGRTA